MAAYAMTVSIIFKLLIINHIIRMLLNKPPNDNSVFFKNQKVSRQSFWPSTNHSLLRPSRRIHLQISLHVFLGPLQPSCLWALVRGGPVQGFWVAASLWRLLHLDVGGTPEAPAASNTGFCVNLCVCMCESTTNLFNSTMMTFFFFLF